MVWIFSRRVSDGCSQFLNLKFSLAQKPDFKQIQLFICQLPWVYMEIAEFKLIE